MKYYVVMREYEGIQTSYKVYVTTESNPDTSDFTQLFEETGDSDGEYVARTLQMGAYAGQTIRIAFRNVTAQEGDAMAIDNVYIGVPVVPDMALEGPEEVRVGDACEFTANTDFPPIEWTVDGTVVTATGTTLMYTFTTAGNHVVKASATNVAGTSSDSIVVNAVLCEAHELPYTPNLSTDIDICWENDGWGTMADQAGNTYIYSMSNFYGIFDLDPDNWIYTPALTMPAEGSFEIAWQVMPYETSLPSDHYGVYVVQNGTPTQLFQETLTANMTSFQQRAVTIPETVTGEFKVAFRHYETTGGYVILIGDIKVVTAGTTPIVGIDGVNEANVAIYPNPATSVLRVEGEGIEQVEIIDVNGRVVMNTKAGRINVSSLADGIYMVRVVTADGVSTQKIVKK